MKLEQEKIKTMARHNVHALLRQRPRSEHEVRIRLKQKGYEESVIEEVIADFRRVGELDDMKFARIWMESRMRMNPVGDVVLKYELREKGVSDPIIEATLAEKAKEYDEYEVAFNMAKEKFERFKKLDKRKAMKRIYDFLVRRGFTYDNVRRVVEELNKWQGSRK